MFLLVCFAPGMLTEATGRPTERGRESWRLAFYCRSRVQSGLDSSEVQPCRLPLAAAASSGRSFLRRRPPASAIPIGYRWTRNCFRHLLWCHICLLPLIRSIRILKVFSLTWKCFFLWRWSWVEQILQLQGLNSGFIDSVVGRFYYPLVIDRWWCWMMNLPPYFWLVWFVFLNLNPLHACRSA